MLNTYLVLSFLNQVRVRSHFYLQNPFGVVLKSRKLLNLDGQ